MKAKFKLISSAAVETFEERLNRFIASLGADDVVVDVKFSTATSGGSVEYSALVHYRQSGGWGE